MRQKIISSHCVSLKQRLSNFKSRQMSKMSIFISVLFYVHTYSQFSNLFMLWRKNHNINQLVLANSVSVCIISRKHKQSLKLLRENYGSMGCQNSKVGIQNQIDFWSKFNKLTCQQTQCRVFKKCKNLTFTVNFQCQK